jgi:hypothetical protein
MLLGSSCYGVQETSASAKKRCPKKASVKVSKILIEPTPVRKPVVNASRQPASSRSASVNEGRSRAEHPQPPNVRGSRVNG